MADSICSFEGCHGTINARGLCKSHYDKQRAASYKRPATSNPKRAPRGAALAHYLMNKDVITDECKIWPYATNGDAGYGMLSIGGRMRLVHTVACEDRWGAPPEPGMFAAHGPCHNRLCWNADHLSWKTPAQNTADMERDGTKVQGELTPQSKLTEAQVREIRAAVAAGASQRSVAAEYGVQAMAISMIVRRKYWKHVA